MTSAILYLLSALLVLAVAVLAFAYARLARSQKEDPARALQLLQADIAARVDSLAHAHGDLQRLLGEQLSRSQGLVQQQLQGQSEILQKHMQGSQVTLSALTEKMGAIQQASVRMAELGKEMEELQSLLRSPKPRGTLGEIGLEGLLNDILPRENVLSQYAFKDGKKVDFAIKLDRGLLPIDAKFPVEDFQRYVEAQEEEKPKARKAFHANLKKKIDEIAKLYVRPDEGTLPLALMYLPAESLYYEAFVARERGEEDLWEYSFSKSVLPLSPATLAAYLKTVAMGLKAAAVEQSARQVMQLLQSLERNLAAFRESHEVLGKHLNNAQQKYEETARHLGSFENNLARAKDFKLEEGSAEKGKA
ncbi:MAG: DNA recombination protein RmuC [Acidobacteria bacterium]|jgi:DNA recombination protein RmuC|nr:DNA recombination protein RmuC [Acidobacteriota bacterium]